LFYLEHLREHASLSAHETARFLLFFYFFYEGGRNPTSSKASKELRSTDVMLSWMSQA
jgi:hypothetical protein